jgi:hypothetical protein
LEVLSKSVSNDRKKIADEFQYNFRRFLLFSERIDRAQILAFKATSFSWRERFKIEALLSTANVTKFAYNNLFHCFIKTKAQNVEDFLRRLLTEEDADLYDLQAAELLCSRFPTPGMLRQMFNHLLHLSKFDFCFFFPKK